MNTVFLVIWAAFDDGGMMSITPAEVNACHRVQALVSQSADAIAVCAGSAREVAHLIDAGHCQYITEDEDGQHYGCRNKP